ncbi:MAG: hypothetical protein K6B69_08825 [Lachnospiraceae bacterium]|nr:hypothetical protein [Lachnospiraceae bacterium]
MNQPKQVKIDQDIYELLEAHYTEDKELSEEDLLRIKQFFVRKWKAPYTRANHVDEYYAEQRIKNVVKQ